MMRRRVLLGGSSLVGLSALSSLSGCAGRRAPSTAIGASGAEPTNTVGAQRATQETPAGSGLGARSVSLQDARGQAFEAMLWEPAQPDGLVLYLHGLGGHPRRQRTSAIAACLQQNLAVLAPVHLDGTRNALLNRLDLQGGYTARIAQTNACTNFIDERWPKLPVSVMGYSYGTLFATMLGGALPGAGAAPWRRVAGIACYSSPGVLPMMDRNTAFNSLRVPMMFVTGTRDVVPGYVSDWRDHQAYFDGAPALGRAASHVEVVVPGAGHGLINEAPPTLLAASAQFLRQAMQVGTRPQPLALDAAWMVRRK
jgi:pimeloyl-ACP methyl ester carboxylesterase